MKAFEKYHPTGAFLYFLGVIFFTMLSLNPVVIIGSFVFSILFSFMLKGLKSTLKSLAYSLPILIIITITNPIFVHRGETILFFLNGNPFTKEAMVYGSFAAMMLMAVFYWFKSYHYIMTSDKHVYLFGRVAPKLSLLLAMVLGFIPKLKNQYVEIDQTQKTLGIYSTKSYVDKIKSKLLIFSILITWSLESSIETAESMKARGYGLKGRTSFANFKFMFKDKIFILFVSFLTIIIGTLMILGYANFEYYPALSIIEKEPLNVLLYIFLLVLFGLPTIIEIKENILWRYLKSKI